FLGKRAWSSGGSPTAAGGLPRRASGVPLNAMLFSVQQARSAGSAGVGEQSDRSIVWQSIGAPPPDVVPTVPRAKPTTKVRTGFIGSVERAFAMFSDRS